MVCPGDIIAVANESILCLYCSACTMTQQTAKLHSYLLCSDRLACSISAHVNQILYRICLNCPIVLATWPAISIGTLTLSSYAHAHILARWCLWLVMSMSKNWQTNLHISRQTCLCNNVTIDVVQYLCFELSPSLPPHREYSTSHSLQNRCLHSGHSARSHS